MAKKSIEVVEVNQAIETVEAVDVVEEATETTDDEKHTVVSIEEYDALLAKHLNEVNSQVAAYNDLDDDATSKADFLAVQEKIDKAVKAYNDISFAKLLRRLRASDDPMKLVLVEYSYPTIKAQLKTEGDEVMKVEQMVVIPVEKPINLKTINSRIKNFGKDSRWIYLADKFNMLMTMRVTQEVSGIDAAKAVNTAFDICDEARQIVLQPDLLSKNKMMKALQLLIDAMLGEGSYKITSNDIKFIEWRYCKKGKEKLTIKSSNQSDFLQTLLNVGHKLVTGSVYKVDFKHKKN